MAEHTAEVAGHATELADHGAEAAEHATGLPQLDFSTFPNQIFWLLVTLLVIYLVLNRVALPRIASVLAERSGTITNDIAAAEELKLRAAEAEEAYNRAQAEARSEAQGIGAKAREAVQAELDEAIKKAEAEIAARTAESEARIGEIRAGADAAVAEVAKATAKEIVAALSGGSASDAAVNAAVDARTKG